MGSSNNADEKEASPSFWANMVTLARKNWHLILFVVVAAIFFGLLEDVLEGEITKLDTMAYELFVVNLRSDALTPLMEGLSTLGSPVVVVVMAAILAAFAPGRRPARCVGLNLICAIALNLLLKNIIQRPRPEGFRLIAESGYSFPSGHSMFSMAFFGLIIWMIWHYEQDRVQRVGWSIFFWIILIGIGISRIYLGVHYASDVVAGFCVSFLWLAFYTRVIAPPLLGPPTAAPSQAG